MKKLSVLILVLALLATVFVACTDDPATDPTDTAGGSNEITDTTPEESEPEATESEETEPEVEETLADDGASDEDVMVGILNGDYTPDEDDYDAEDWGGEY